MPYSLKGRKVLVTGDSRGLGAVICEKFAAEGSNIVVNYVNRKDRADEVVRKCEAGFGVKSTAIQAVGADRPVDIGVADDFVRLVKEAAKELGGLEIVVNNAGWTKFTDFGNLDALTRAEWDKCWHVNVMSHLALLQQAAPIFQANDDGGVFLITSSGAGIGFGGSSMGYSVTKAAGIHLVKRLASTQGPKIRVNALLPGVLLTEWGLQFSGRQLQGSKERAILKQETKTDDCANAFVFAAKNSSMTGREVIVGMDLPTSYDEKPLTRKTLGLC